MSTSRFSRHFDDSQVIYLQTATQASGALSLLGSAGVLATYAFFPRYRNSTTKITVLLAVADIFSNFAKVIGRAGPNAGSDSALCQSQAFFMQWGDIASIIISAIMAINVFLVIQLKRSTKFVSKWYYYYFFIAFGPTFLSSILPVFVETPPDETLYGNAHIWCWFTSKHPYLQLFLLFIPMLIIFIFNVVIYTWVGITLWKDASKLKNERHDKVTALQAYRAIYAKNVSLYLIAFFISWTPSLINRLFEITHAGQVPFGFALLQSIFSPLRGFTDSIAFAYSTVFVNLAAEKLRMNLKTVPADVNNTIKSFYSEEGFDDPHIWDDGPMGKPPIDYRKEVDYDDCVDDDDVPTVPPPAFAPAYFGGNEKRLTSHEIMIAMPRPTSIGSEAQIGVTRPEPSRNNSNRHSNGSNDSEGSKEEEKEKPSRTIKLTYHRRPE